MNLTLFWPWVCCGLPLLCWDISCICLYSLGLLLWKSARFVSKINYHISVTWLRYTNPSASDRVFNAVELSLWLSWTSICWQIIHYVILSLKCWLSSIYAQVSVLALCEIHRDSTYISVFKSILFISGKGTTKLTDEEDLNAWKKKAVKGRGEDSVSAK